MWNKYCLIVEVGDPTIYLGMAAFWIQDVSGELCIPSTYVTEYCLPVYED